MAEVMGYAPLIAPQATNCAAPDTGNMGTFSVAYDDTESSCRLLILLPMIPSSLLQIPSSLIITSPLPSAHTEVFARYGNEAQKRKYLVPLLNGEIRSSFAMTEFGGTFFVPCPSFLCSFFFLIRVAMEKMAVMHRLIVDCALALAQWLARMLPICEGRLGGKVMRSLLTLING